MGLSANLTHPPPDLPLEGGGTSGLAPLASLSAIARQAKAEHAAIYWGDEMGLRSDHVVGRSYAPLGKTPG